MKIDNFLFFTRTRYDFSDIKKKMDRRLEQNVTRECVCNSELGSQKQMPDLLCNGMKSVL